MAIFDFKTTVLVLSLFCALLPLIFYPVLLWFVSLFYTSRKRSENSNNYDLSMIIVVHNGEALIEEKINNTLDLNYGEHNVEILIYLDGCTDHTLQKIESFSTDKIRVIDEPRHLGKHVGLNSAAKQSKGEILLFTDADAMLDKDAIIQLLTNFNDPECGGVCGQRKIKDKAGLMQTAQKFYIEFDSLIKRLESKTGNVSSNDGKLYAIRSRLFSPVVAAVTDDLYQSLCTIEQGYHFVFDATATTGIRTPARNSEHELLRRRRIVSTSLHGIYLKRHLLNPFRYGFYSFSLLINKVIRRLLPVFLILIFLSSGAGAQDNDVFRGFFILQCSFYLLAGSYFLFSSQQHNILLKLLKRITSIGWYFCIGNYATLLGIWDFLSGKRIEKWQPQKEQ